MSNNDIEAAFRYRADFINSIRAIDPVSLQSIPLSQYKSLPPVRGVYFVFSNDRILYIGCSINIKNRWRQHQYKFIIDDYPGSRISWIEIHAVETPYDYRMRGMMPNNPENFIELECIRFFNPELNKARWYEGKKGGDGNKVST